MLGMLSPSSRGSLTSVAIFLYCFMGLVSGYHSGRLYKTLRGNKPKLCAFRVKKKRKKFLLNFLNFFLDCNIISWINFRNWFCFELFSY